MYTRACCIYIIPANKTTFIVCTGWPSRIRTNETKRPEKVDELELQLPTTGFSEYYSHPPNYFQDWSRWSETLVEIVCDTPDLSRSNASHLFLDI